MPDLPRPGSDHPPDPIDLGEARDGAVTFENWRGAEDRPEPEPPAPWPPERRVGFAIMGLGRLALGQILPAFGSCRFARPVALISDRADKMATVAAQYGIPEDRLYTYDEIERIADAPDIEAVFVVTPNGRHEAHVRAIAAAGKNVLCEKPMANNSAEARAMIAACERAGVKLMIAYRCHYEAANRALRDMLRAGELGDVRLIEASNTQMQGPGEQWRFVPSLAGGGTLPDIGLYCLNGVRMVAGEEPVSVSATIHRPPGDPRYAVLDETVSFTLCFASGAIANCAASYGAHESKDMRVHTTKAHVSFDDAFAYQGQSLSIAHRRGDIEAVDELRIAGQGQFAAEIDHFATCIRENRTPDTPGEEGLRDHLLMEAIYRAAEEGRTLKLAADGSVVEDPGPRP